MRDTSLRARPYHWLRVPRTATAETMLIATAGHIDHGKTSLVRAITGVETDKLPEERRRGISIDLGFAYWAPLADRTIGFIDVPGHEKLVRNMLAGATTVDFALIVVAADDGVMPQTIEHVAILDLLGVQNGAVAITKCDGASKAQIAAATLQVRDLLNGTGLRAAPILEVSSLTGSGIAGLSEALIAASRTVDRSSVENRHFRFAIDRSFSVPGAGTIVTGTVLQGALRAGTRLKLSPAGLDVRARTIQSAGKKVEYAQAGQRCAINIAGVELSDVRRGDWLTDVDSFAPTDRFDAHIRILSDQSLPLRHNSRVHLHHGTADITARVLLRGKTALAPGQDAIVQLVLDHPTSAVTGDHLVLRDQSARHTLGGGVVLDPLATPIRRRDAGRLAILESLRLGDPAAALSRIAHTPDCMMQASKFELAHNLTKPAAIDLYERCRVEVIGREDAYLLSKDRIAHLENTFMGLVDAHHEKRAGEDGLPIANAQKALALSQDIFQAVLRRLIDQRRLTVAGATVRRPHNRTAANSDTPKRWQQLLTTAESLQTNSFGPADIARHMRVSEKAVDDLIFQMRGDGALWRITDTRLLLGAQVRDFARVAASLSEASSNGFTVAQFRDASGAGRNLIIHLLEFFDDIGITRRQGDVRRATMDFERTLARAAQLERGKPMPQARRPGPKRQRL